MVLSPTTKDIGEQPPWSSARFEIERIDKLVEDWEPPTSVIYKAIPKGNIIVGLGDAGAGKTTVLMDMGLSSTCLPEWHGKKCAENIIFVVIAGEGFRNIVKRIKAWAKKHNIDIAVMPVFISKTACSLYDESSMIKVRETLQYIADAYPDKHIFLLIDTLARNLGAANESFPSDMSRVIENIDHYIRNEFDITVVIAHHVGVSDKRRARGASSLEGAADVIFLVTKDKDKNLRITFTKFKDDEAPEPLMFSTEVVEIDEVDEMGNPLTALVLQSAEYSELAKKTRLGNNQGRAITVLYEMYVAIKKDLSESGLDPEIAVVTTAMWKTKLITENVLKNEKYYRQDFNKLKKSLTENGSIRIDVDIVCVV